MTNYKQYYQEMVQAHSQLFQEFQDIHQKYQKNSQQYQDQFNQIGQKVLVVINDYEGRLCAKTERGQYSVYSGQLAEKFQTELKKHFPLIDFIGVKITKQKPPKKSSKSSDFSLKKISLS